MFSTANSAAKMAEEIMRMHMSKEKARLVKLGLIEEPFSSSKTASNNSSPKKTARSLTSTSCTSSSDNFSGIFDIKKSEIRKAEAKYTISKAIDNEETRLGDTKRRMQHIDAMAKMRHSSGNQLGVVLSMRQLKTTQSNYQTIQEIIKELRAMSTSIGNNATKPDDCVLMIKEIVERPRSSNKMESDDDFLNQLRSGKFKRSIFSGLVR
jgi:hypothetical protein